LYYCRLPKTHLTFFCPASAHKYNLAQKRILIHLQSHKCRFINGAISVRYESKLFLVKLSTDGDAPSGEEGLAVVEDARKNTYPSDGIGAMLLAVEAMRLAVASSGSSGGG
jgi:hypothetical protein